MIARLLIGPLLERKAEISKIMASHLAGANTHPDLLYFPLDSKLGIAESRRIKEHFSLKPYSAKGRVVVLEDAQALTIEAQHSLLKILEELPKEALFILGATSDAKLLPTILSRCQIVRLQGTGYSKQSNYSQDMEKLLTSAIHQRFEYIEKLKDREEFLKALVAYFHHQMYHGRRTIDDNLDDNLKDFLKELLQAEEWAEGNVNIRGILEYLMLVMPQKL